MRLDIYLYENGFAPSRSKASSLVKEGCVQIDGKVVVLPSYEMNGEKKVEVGESPELRYVSRGGLKLEWALSFFKVDVRNYTAVDFGASTGGFTDCLLQNGAAKVYSVDSGTNQLALKLRNDSRVISIENCNARYLTEKEIPEKCDLAVCDLSFISQTYIYPTVVSVLKENGLFLSLVKPQFEVGKANIGKGGIVKNFKAVDNAIEALKISAGNCGLLFLGLTDSPIRGGDGNREYLAAFRYKPQ